MVKELIFEIEQKIAHILNNKQIEELHKVLVQSLFGVTIYKNNKDDIEKDKENKEYLQDFITAKRVEGCSEKTIKYYDSTIKNALETLDKPIKQIVTEDLRTYLSDYQKTSLCSKVNLDNIRRILSSFFSWLEDENHIMKSPVRRIRKIKTTKTVKETYTDENLEVLRDNCTQIRDLAIIDLLNSTGWC